MSRDKLQLFIILAILAVLGNYFSLPLFFGVDFIFGSIFAILAILTLPLPLAVAIGAIGGSYTYILWGHPYALIIFTLEILIVGLLYHKREQSNILLYSLIFWLFIGTPLVIIFYKYVLQLPDIATVLIVLKQSLNGIFNTIIASIIIFFLPIRNTIRKSKYLPFSQILSTLLISAIIISSGIVMIISANNSKRVIDENLRSSMKQEAQFITYLIKSKQHTNSLNLEYSASIIEREKITQIYGETKHHKTEEYKELKNGFYQYFPKDVKAKMVMWKKSSLIYQTNFDEKVIHIETSLAPYIDEIQKNHIFSLSIMFLITLLAIIGSILIANIFTEPIRELTKTSKDLPKKVLNQEEIIWFDGYSTEIKELTNNYEEVIKTLQDLFSKLQNSNEELEKKVVERTKELRENKIALEDLNRNLETKIIEEVEKNREKDKILLTHARQAAMGEMISMIAHQWRQPITSIGMSVDNILLDIELQSVDEKDVEKKLELINQQVQYLSSTIDDFRSFFKQENKQEEVQITEVIEESLSIIAKSISVKDIKIVKNFEANTTLYLYKNEIIQVFLNLVKNSQDIFLEKEVKNPTIFISTYENSDDFFIDFEDNGGGVEKKNLSKIFDPYFSTKEEKNGTGIGLYMCKNVLEHHNGAIEVKNGESGALFHLKFSKKTLI